MSPRPRESLAQPRPRTRRAWTAPLDRRTEPRWRPPRETLGWNRRGTPRRADFGWENRRRSDWPNEASCAPADRASHRVGWGLSRTIGIEALFEIEPVGHVVTLQGRCSIERPARRLDGPPRLEHECHGV